MVLNDENDTRTESTRTAWREELLVEKQVRGKREAYVLAANPSCGIQSY
jgi:hypothetical protein